MKIQTNALVLVLIQIFCISGGKTNPTIGLGMDFGYNVGHYTLEQKSTNDVNDLPEQMATSMHKGSNYNVGLKPVISFINPFQSSNPLESINPAQTISSLLLMNPMQQKNQQALPNDPSLMRNPQSDSYMTNQYYPSQVGNPANMQNQFPRRKRSLYQTNSSFDYNPDQYLMRNMNPPDFLPALIPNTPPNQVSNLGDQLVHSRKRRDSSSVKRNPETSKGEIADKIMALSSRI